MKIERNFYTLRQVYKKTHMEERETIIDTVVDRETAKDLLKSAGMNLKDVKRFGTRFYKGVERGINCEAYII